MGGDFGNVCVDFEDEAELFVDELGNEDSGLHWNSSDGKGVCHDRQYTGAPDSEFAGKSESSVAQDLAEAPISLPSQIKTVLEISELVAGVADPRAEVVVGLDHLNREGSGSDLDFQGRFARIKLGELRLQGAARRGALQGVQHDGFGGGHTQSSLLENLDQGSGRTQAGSELLLRMYHPGGPDVISK